MRDRFAEVRYEVWFHARRMWEAGLVVGSSGNISRRLADEPNLIAITPTSITYDDMAAPQIVIVDLATGKSVHSRDAPSYELPMHRAVYRRLPSVTAVVHTHSPFVTTLSVLRRPLPPLMDEMMLQFGGPIDVAEYAFTGTEEVGDNVVRALGDRAGVLLANHGNVCVGSDLQAALQTAMLMEAAARVYVQSLQVGEPVALPEPSIEAGRVMFEERRGRKPS